MSQLLFRSTNGQSPAVNLREAFLAGQAPDRGLYLPEAFPQLALDEIEHLTFDISPAEHWRIDFLPFWQTMRSVHQDTKGTRPIGLPFVWFVPS